MNLQTGQKNPVQPLQILVDDHGVIELRLPPPAPAPSTELPRGTQRVQVLKARFERLIDYLFEVA